MEAICLQEVYCATTHQIRVEAQPSHLEAESCPARQVFAFSYRIKIDNLGKNTVQLFERRWVVYSGESLLAEIAGPGVVGLQPVLRSGESFEYSSSVIIRDPIGSMHGSYVFHLDDGTSFEVRIPRFHLLYPLVVH